MSKLNATLKEKYLIFTQEKLIRRFLDRVMKWIPQFTKSLFISSIIYWIEVSSKLDNLKIDDLSIILNG